MAAPWASVDPSTLKPWTPPSAMADAANPIHAAFELSMPDAAKALLASRSAAALPADLQWVHALTTCAASLREATLPTRWLAGTPGGEGLVVDVLTVRRCPEELPAEPSMRASAPSSTASAAGDGAAAGAGGSHTGAPAATAAPPVLVVRYKYMAELDGAHGRGPVVERYACAELPVITTPLPSADAVHHGRGVLEEGQRLVSETYATDMNLSADDWGLSLIAPPPCNEHHAGLVGNECSLPSCDATATPDTRLQRCSKCKAAFYCSRDHQLAHWPHHKAECKKAAAAAGGGAAAAAAATAAASGSGAATADDVRMVRVDLDVAQPDAYYSLMSLNAGPSVTKKRGSPPPDPHHGAKFLVKVQPALTDAYVNDMLCYDKARTFTVLIKPKQPGGANLVAAIHKYGVYVRGGYKGFFHARRDGGALEVFVDEMAPPQGW